MKKNILPLFMAAFAAALTLLFARPATAGVGVLATGTPAGAKVVKIEPIAAGFSATTKVKDTAAGWVAFEATATDGKTTVTMASDTFQKTFVELKIPAGYVPVGITARPKGVLEIVCASQINSGPTNPDITIQVRWTTGWHLVETVENGLGGFRGAYSPTLTQAPSTAEKNKIQK